MLRPCTIKGNETELRAAMPKILIIEDEPSIAKSLEFVLQSEGFETHWESLAQAGLTYIENDTTDLVIMDIGLPDMTGLEACKLLRQTSQLPVMFLTARGDELDRVVGLEIGADDYVVKPFSPREVAARVKAILKRTMPITNAIKANTLPTQNHAFIVDAESYQITCENHLLPFTKIEFLVFQMLLSHPNRVFSRSQLLAAIGGVEIESYERTIDSHIKSIRAKLRKCSAGASVIKTSRGFGYSFQVAR